jgi:hypothetical protein
MFTSFMTLSATLRPWPDTACLRTNSIPFADAFQPSNDLFVVVEEVLVIVQLNTAPAHNLTSEDWLI